MDSIVCLQRDEITRLRARVRELEAMLAPEGVRIDDRWGLVNAERIIFSALAMRDIVPKERLYDALYSGRNDLDDPPQVSCVESHVSKLRKKLRRFGIEISSRRFVGYSLHDRQRFLVRPEAS